MAEEIIPESKIVETKKNDVGYGKIILFVALGVAIGYLLGHYVVIPSPTGAAVVDNIVVKLTVVNDKNCKLCDSSNVVAAIKKLFPDLEVNEIDYTSKEGSNIIKELNINLLPAYIFDKNVEKTSQFSTIAETLIPGKEGYLINPGVVGPVKLLKPVELGDAYVKGDKNAPLTIVEFSEFQCPFCGKFVKEIMSKIEEEYIGKGKVKVAFKHFPLGFHQYAKRASIASECAGEQGKFWEYHNLLFDNQEKLTDSDLKEYAQKLNLEMGKFSSCLETEKYAEKIERNLKQGQELGITGTPGFFVGDMMVVGAQPYETFKLFIDSKL